MPNTSNNLMLIKSFLILFYIHARNFVENFGYNSAFSFIVFNEISKKVAQIGKRVDYCF